MADPIALLADVTALLAAGLAPERAWAIVGVETDGRGVPLPPARPGLGAPGWTPDSATATAVRSACELAWVTGMPLARVLVAVARAVSRAHEARDAIEAELAGPRMSARVLRWLPAIGLVLALAVDPGGLAGLMRSPLGWVLLGLAGLLTWAGSAWMGRLVARAGPDSSGDLGPEIVIALVDAALASGLDVATALARTADALEAAGGARSAGGAGDADDGRAALAGAPRGTGGGDRRRAVTAGRSAARAGRLVDDLRALASASAYGDDVAVVAVETRAGEALRRPLALAATAGAPASAGLRAAAERLDREERARARRAAGELGVRLTLPLALCLLPAFALAGVVPLVVAIVSGAGFGDTSLGETGLGGLGLDGMSAESAP